MRYERLKKFILPPVPIGIFTLMGLLLLSALLYYEAVKAQRYLEPSLSLAQPRVEFLQNISNLLEEEFGSKYIKGITLSRNSIFIDSSLIFADPAYEKGINYVFLKKLSRVFLYMFRDADMRSHFDLILLSTSFKFSQHLEVNTQRRAEKQHIAEIVMDSMYKVESGLYKYYGLFAAIAVPVEPERKGEWLEFRIIRSEHLHIELMKSLKKYFF